MPFRWNVQEHVSLLRHLAKWLLLSIPLGLLVGLAVAGFLKALEVVTLIRWENAWLIVLLPLGGALVGGLYQAFGRGVEGGNNLIMEQIHEPGGGVPRRMAPLVLIGTVLTHLFGGSAGREGTAVQMGGSIAGAVARLLKLKEVDVRLLLMAGVAAGFGAVFGTPLTGAVFALEVLAIGVVRYEAVIRVLPPASGETGWYRVLEFSTLITALTPFLRGIPSWPDWTFRCFSKSPSRPFSMGWSAFSSLSSLMV